VKGCPEAAEHGLGAGPSIGSRSRVRPLKRFEAFFEIAMPVCPPARNDKNVNQGGTTVNFIVLAFL